jgi:hypothetical protein
MGRKKQTLLWWDDWKAVSELIKSDALGIALVGEMLRDRKFRKLVKKKLGPWHRQLMEGMEFQEAKPRVRGDVRAAYLRSALMLRLV